uniref:CNDH2_C domain-containing protein n=1 Tax=Rhabditophanes sp. KR3021 TaxID=114890 RepID=A0AC35TU51_9BILA
MEPYEAQFRQLMQPVGAIGELFGCDLSSILNRHSDDLSDLLKKITERKDKGPNQIDFVRAGYLVSNSTLVFGVKVDSLSRRLIAYIDVLNSGEKKELAVPTEDNAEAVMNARLDNDRNPFILLPISALKSGSLGGRTIEYDSMPVEVFPKVQAALMPLSENEKKNVNLFSTTIAKHAIGKKDDFLINTCSFLDSGAAILDFDFLDIIDVVMPAKEPVVCIDLYSTVGSSQVVGDFNAKRNLIMKDLEENLFQHGEDSVVEDDHEVPAVHSGIEEQENAREPLGVSLNNPNTFLSGVMVDPSLFTTLNGNEQGHKLMIEENIDLKMDCTLNGTALDMPYEPDYGSDSLGRSCIRSTQAARVNLEMISKKIRGVISDVDVSVSVDSLHFYYHDELEDPAQTVGRKGSDLSCVYKPNAKIMEYSKLFDARTHSIKALLEKQCGVQNDLTYAQVVEYFRLKGNSKNANFNFELCVYDPHRLYEVTLYAKKQLVKVQRKKQLQECERNMMAASGVPDLVASVMVHGEEVIQQEQQLALDEYDDELPSMHEDDDVHVLGGNEMEFHVGDFQTENSLSNITNISVRKRKSTTIDPSAPVPKKEYKFQNLDSTVFIRQDTSLPVLSYSEIIEKYNEKYWTSIDEEVRESSRQVVEWEDNLKPYLKTEEERKNFDIHGYGRTLISKFKNITEKISFKEMVKTFERYLIPRYFLSSLLLVNKTNFKATAGENVNQVVFELIKTDLSHEDGDV